MRISLVNICCVCLILFLTGGAWHIYAEEVSLNILRKGELAVKKSTVIHPAAEQLQLSRQLTKIAEKSPDYQTFEKEASRIIAIPANPAEPCELPELIRQRIVDGEKSENISALFADLIHQWYKKGYLITETQIVPVQLFLRQFYDNYKMPSVRKNQSEMEEISPAAEYTADRREHIVRVSSVEGEGNSAQEALSMAIKEALGRVNAYWSNKTEAATVSDGNDVKSSFSENTMIIYGGTVRHYDIVSSQQIRNGKYRIIINAEVEKSSSGKKQQVNSFDLTTEYVRIENRNNAAEKVAELLSHLPEALFRVNHSAKIPDQNIIRIRGEVALNLEEYARWTGQIAQIMSRVSLWESSFATLRVPLERFFHGEKSLDGIKAESLYVCDLRQNYGSQPIQDWNGVDAVYFRKYTLPERLIRKITDCFTVSPAVFIDLEDGSGQKIFRKKVQFSDLGIEFLPKDRCVIMAGNGEQIRWQTVSVPLFIQPFFYDKDRRERALQFSFEIELTLPEKLYNKHPSVKVFALAQQEKEKPFLRYDPELPTKDEGISCYHAGEYKEAERIFSKLAKHRKSDPDLNYYSGRLAFEWKKDTEKAIEYLKRNSDDARSLNYLGELYRKSNRKAEALECYRRSALLGNSEGEGRYGLALLKEEPGKGIQYLLKSADKGHLASSYHAAEYYRKHKEFDKAFPYYKKAADTKEDFKQYTQCLYYTAFSYAKGHSVAKNEQTALFYLAKIIKGRAKYPEAQYLAGEIKLAYGKKREAKDHFRRAAEAGHEQGMYEYGCILLQQQDLKKAMLYLKKAAAKNSMYYYSSGVELLRSGQNGEAEKMFLESLKKNYTDRGKTFMILGTIYEGRKDFTQAEKYVQKAAEAGESSALCIMGEKALQKGNWDEAHKYLIKVHIDPRALLLHGELHENRSFKAYSPRQALSLYEQAYKIADKQNNAYLKKESAARIQKMKKQLESVKH